MLADPHARALSKSEVVQLLAQPNILRLAYIDENGGPVVHPMWYYYNKGTFFAATDAKSGKARTLRKYPLVYFLVDESPKGGPTRGVRGKGIVKVINDATYATRVTRRNVMKYFGNLTSKAARIVLEWGSDSCVLEITPLYMATWKF